MKRFTAAGRSSAETEPVAELLEQCFSASDAFLENMRGRMESRLTLLRRSEPLLAGCNADQLPGHAPFRLGFSRLCALLRRVERPLAG